MHKGSWEGKKARLLDLKHSYNSWVPDERLRSLYNSPDYNKKDIARELLWQPRLFFLSLEDKIVAHISSHRHTKFLNWRDIRWRVGKSVRTLSKPS